MELSRPSRRTVLGALAGGSVTGLAGWHLLVRPLPFTRPDRRMRETASLGPGKGPENSRFGSSVAVADGTVVVGAPRAAEPNGRWGGAVAVFERTDGGWTRRARLASDDGQPGAEFGADVALEGNTAIVGAPQTTTRQGRDSGAAVVFERTDDGWRERTILTPARGDSNDQFGRAVALSGSTALVGAPTDEQPNGDLSGSATVFTRSEGEWTQEAKLTAEDGDGGDVFGRAVALSDRTALVGAPFDEDPHGSGAGAAYVFEKADGAWEQSSKLTPTNATSGDEFGGSVALGGATALVGAPFAGHSSGSSPGAAYIFGRGNDKWSQRAKLVAEDGKANDEFGRAVALDGRAALVGAPGASTPDGDRAGSAHLFWRRLGRWPQMSRLLASDGTAFDRFGQTVGLDSHRAVIGAGPGTKDGENTATGATYIFDL